MSKVGKQPIEIPDKINIKVTDGKITVSNGSDTLEVKRLNSVGVEKKDNQLIFSLKEDTKQARSNWGTLRSLTSNAIQGLTEGFEKNLVLKGVGYRINKKGENIELSLGFSHPIVYEKPEGITFEIEGKDKLKIKGKDKALVGQTAAEIRNMKPVEPYKGKGFRYKDEEVRRKPGKKAVGEGVGGEGAAV